MKTEVTQISKKKAIHANEDMEERILRLEGRVTELEEENDTMKEKMTHFDKLNPKLTQANEENKRLRDKIKKLEEQVPLIGITEDISIKREFLQKLNSPEERSYEIIDSIRGKRWSEDIYKKTKIIEGSILRAPIEHDLVIPIAGDCNFDKEIYKKVKKRYREIEILDMEEGNIGDLLERKIGIPEHNGINYKSSYLFLITHKANEKDHSKPEDLFNVTEILKKLCATLDRKRLAYPVVVGEENAIGTRRIFEYAFRRTDIEMVLYTLPKPENSNKKALKKQNKSNEEALLIRTSGQSYADMLKTVKEKVNTKALGITVDGVKKTRKGDLLILTKIGTGDAQKLKNSIESSVGVKVVSIDQTQGLVLHIKDLDAVTEKDEVTNFLKELGFQQDKYEITLIRPATNETKVITVKMGKTEAKKLVEMKRIRIGWKTCRVQERIPLPRACGRCWVIGHKRQDCMGLDRTGLCRRCGKPGHMAASCSSNVKCLACSVEGHQTFSKGYPKAEAQPKGQKV